MADDLSKATHVDLRVTIDWQVIAPIANTIIANGFSKHYAFLEVAHSTMVKAVREHTRSHYLQVPEQLPLMHDFSLGILQRAASKALPLNR